jgi:hypothetical protein
MRVGVCLCAVLTRGADTRAPNRRPGELHTLATANDQLVAHMAGHAVQVREPPARLAAELDCSPPDALLSQPSATPPRTACTRPHKSLTTLLRSWPRWSGSLTHHSHMPHTHITSC